MRLSSAFPGTIAGPRDPPLRRVSRCRTSRPDVWAAPWQTAHLPTRRLTADSRIAGSCALPARQRNRRSVPADVPIQIHLVSADVIAVQCLKNTVRPILAFSAKLLTDPSRSLGLRG